jgi:hypothetical protein
MSDEMQTQEPAATGGDNAEALQRSVEALERKNKELIAELRAAKKSPAVPEGINIDELLEFKRTYEQQQLESQGKYTEARQALEQQFREATAQKDQRIAELESRVRELELVTPAVTALADIVHDPDMVLKTKLRPESIEREPDGTVVVVDGYERKPVAEWAKTLPSWMQKQPKPQGSGAPSAGATGSGGVPAGMTNPFSRDNFNLTEQARLFKTDRDLYERMKATANR